jgi:hypothetical protein
MLERQIDIKQIKPKAVLFFIRAAKNEMISPEEFPRHYGGYIEDMLQIIYPDFKNN